MALTERQLRFVEEYLIDPNATQAAKKAGYSAKTACQQAERLLRNVDVQEAVQAARAARSEKTGIDAEWVLRRLADEATADLGDLYDEDGALRPVHDWPLIWRQGLVAGIDVEDQGEAGVVRKVRLSDRVKRIELIGKHIGVQAFKERVELDVSDDLAAAITAGNARVDGQST